MTDIALGYIAGCAGVTFDPESCIAKEAVKISLHEVERTLSPSAHRLLSGYYGTYSKTNQHLFVHEDKDDEGCGTPFDIDAEMVRDIIDAAELQCILDGRDVSETEKKDAIDTFTSFLGAKECWESLCFEETVLVLISTYFDTCAGIKLPYMLPPVEEMAQQPEIYDPYVKLGCMLDFAMSSDASIFGMKAPLPGSADSCYPPGHEDMKNICSTKIGPVALQECVHATLIKPTHRDDFSYGYSSSSMSFFHGEKCSHSYSYDCDEFYVYDDPEEDAQHINNLCVLLEQLSSETGKQCLNPLCGIPDWLDGSNVPSQAPSLKPSAAPSQVPSQAPSNTKAISDGKTNRDEGDKETSGAGRSSVGSVRLITLGGICWLLSVLFA